MPQAKWGRYTMKKYYVKNLHSGARPAPSGYSSWLDYWERRSGQEAKNCHHSACYRSATDGAHVKLVNGGSEWYIVPLCHPCNLKYGEVLFVDGPLVPVDPFSPIMW